MPRGPYAYTDRDLLSRIRKSPGTRAGYKQLVRELGLGGGRERRLLMEQLTRMVASGQLRRLESGDWALPGGSDPTVRGARSGAGPGMWTGLEQGERSGRERLVSGRLDLHRDGFGFVRTETPGAGDIFIAPDAIHGAMGGDVVLVDEFPPGRDGRRSGRVARVLTRRHPTVVGIFHYGRRQKKSYRGAEEAEVGGDYVTPLDERVGGTVVISGEVDGLKLPEASAHRTLGTEARRSARSMDAEWPLEGLAVDVEITSFPQPGRPAMGRVIEVLGHPDDFGVDVEIVIRKHHIPHAFPAPVLAAADDSAKESVGSLPADELALREDFRAFPVMTIDGETARDFDDAVHVRPLPNGNTELQVHIADVGWYVRSGEAIDVEARVRGTSVYFPDRAVPMLPHALSSGMCSLLPNEDRMVLSCVMEIDGEGEVAGYRVAEGIIRSARRCTYTSVQACLNAAGDKPKAEDIAERERVEFETPGAPEAFDAMLALALKLNAKRVRRGSIDFDLPEPVVQFDPDGNMMAIVRSERGWAHRLIEEFMLSANECVATWLERQGIASIYRIHEQPDPKRILEFEETASAFGQSLGIGSLAVKKLTMKSDRRSMRQESSRGRSTRAPQQHEIPQHIAVTPRMYQKLVRRISGHPEERILSYMMLRSLKQARYSEKNEGHFALASPSYTHFTSPIRRYPDLIVHRLLRAMLRDGADPQGGPIGSTDAQPWQEGSEKRTANSKQFDGPMAAEEIADIASESSQSERRAADAERELIEWKKMKFMADKVGDHFRGMVLSVTKYGFFVELDEMFIEGLVPITSLVGDHWSFRDTDRTICGARTGHCYAPGQRVEVLLDRIDRVQRRLQFALVPGTEPVANTGRGKATAPAATVMVKPGSPREFGERKAAQAKTKKVSKAKRREGKKKRREF